MYSLGTTTGAWRPSRGDLDSFDRRFFGCLLRHRCVRNGRHQPLALYLLRLGLLPLLFSPLLLPTFVVRLGLSSMLALVSSVCMMVVPGYGRHAADKQESAAMTPMKAFGVTSVLVGMPIRHATCTVTRKRLMDHRRGLCCPGLATNARWELFQAPPSSY